MDLEGTYCKCWITGIASNIHKLEKLGIAYTSSIAARVLKELTLDFYVSFVSCQTRNTPG